MLPEQLLPIRLFHPVGARVTPKVEWVEVKVKSVINPVQGMHFNWSINPYRGCAFDCSYCFARVTHWYLDQDGVNDWSSRIFVKVNAPEVLRRELADRRWRRELVAIGTATDPYQPAEGTYRLTRQILESLRDSRTPISIVTKSAMVVRDRDVLKELADIAGATVCFSITTLDPVLAREIEPDAPPPHRRLEALRKLSDAGIATAVLLAPVIPGITDNEANMAAVVKGARENGASSLWMNTLHLGEVTRQAFFQYLGEKRPGLLPEYERLYRGKYAPRDYQRRVQGVVASLKARFGFAGPPRRNGVPPGSPAKPSSTFVQIKLL